MAEANDTDAEVGAEQGEDEDHSDFAHDVVPEIGNDAVRQKRQQEEKVGNGTTNRVRRSVEKYFCGLFVTDTKLKELITFSLADLPGVRLPIGRGRQGASKQAIVAVGCVVDHGTAHLKSSLLPETDSRHRHNFSPCFSLI